MRQAKAIKMFETARAYCEENCSDELEWAESITQKTFTNLRAKGFLTEYCWVIYASGFKVSIIEGVFPGLRVAFKNFQLSDLAKTESIQSALDVFNNERKATSFLQGCKLIAEEGFSKFKKRIKKEGIDALEQLPGIGPITKYHLAKNIGLVDEAKPDIWLERAANACSSNVQDLVIFLSQKYSLSRHIVDVILWRYGADIGF